MPRAGGLMSLGILGPLYKVDKGPLLRDFVTFPGERGPDAMSTEAGYGGDSTDFNHIKLAQTVTCVTSCGRRCVTCDSAGSHS